MKLKALIQLKNQVTFKCVNYCNTSSFARTYKHICIGQSHQKNYNNA